MQFLVTFIDKAIQDYKTLSVISGLKSKPFSAVKIYI